MIYEIREHPVLPGSWEIQVHNQDGSNAFIVLFGGAEAKEQAVAYISWKKSPTTDEEMKRAGGHAAEDDDLIQSYRDFNKEMLPLLDRAYHLLAHRPAEGQPQDGMELAWLEEYAEFSKEKGS